MDQECDLSILMTERYTLGPLGDIAWTLLASMWLGHKNVISQNEIKLGMDDTKWSDLRQVIYHETKGAGYDFFGSHDH
jgi:hypothetical protein